MSQVTQASSTALALKKAYKDAGLDYTGLAEYSDVSGYQDGTNDYVIKAHSANKATCTGLKPDTRVWPRLDGRDLSNYCNPTVYANGTPIIGSASEDERGSPLITDSAGTLTFLYRIPNDADMQFRGLKHLLEVSDVPPPTSSSSGISSGKIGSTTRCGQYLYFPSNQGDFTDNNVKLTPNLALTELVADTSKTIISSTEAEVETPDYMSQAFTVKRKDGDGVRIKRMTLYFADKPSRYDSYVLVQIRETGKGARPIDSVVAQSSPIYSADINVSSDGSVGTTFLFEHAVVLKNNKTYAITVIPNEPNGDFKIWTAREGVPDVASTVNAFFPPTVGPLYGSASGNVWNKMPNEALKFTMSQEEYIVNTEAEFVFENQDLEFLNISDIKPVGQPTGTTGFQVDERIQGESQLTITYTAQPNLGDVYQTEYTKDGGVYKNTAFANGTVRSIISDDGVDTAVLKLDVAGKGFETVGANVYINSTKVGTVSSYAPNTCVGYASFINTDFGRLRLRSSSASSDGVKFEAGKYVRGQNFGASAKIDAVVDPKIDEIDIRTKFLSTSNTSFKWYLKATKAGTTTPDSSWTEITGGRRVLFDKEEKQIYSKSNQSFKSLQVKGIMSTTDKESTPQADIEDIAVVAKRQRINSVSTNETSPAGDASARYVSQVFRISSPSNSDPSPRAAFAASGYYPEGAGIHAFVRAKNDNDSEPLSDKNYTEMLVAESGRSVLGEKQDIQTIVFAPTSNTSGEQFLSQTNLLRMNTANNDTLAYRSSDGSIYHGVDTVQLKVVFTKPDNSGTAYAPELSDLTIIGHENIIEIPVS